MQLPKHLRALYIAAQTQIGAQHPRRLFAAREDRVDHRQIHVANVDVAAQVTTPLRIGHLYLSVKLTIIGQADQPAQFCTIVAQIGCHVQGIERQRQRRIVHRLRHLHVTPGERNITLRQPFFGGVPRNVRFASKYATGLRRLRHKRFQHRQIKAVKIHYRPPFGTRIDGLRHAQFSIRICPAVRPDTDFLLFVTIVQRDGASQGQWPDRRLEAGIAQRAFPALFFTIKTPRQIELAGDRLALNT